MYLWIPKYLLFSFHLIGLPHIVNFLITWSFNILDCIVIAFVLYSLIAIHHLLFNAPLLLFFYVDMLPPNPFQVLLLLLCLLVVSLAFCSLSCPYYFVSVFFSGVQVVFVSIQSIKIIVKVLTFVHHQLCFYIVVYAIYYFCYFCLSSIYSLDCSST